MEKKSREWFDYVYNISSGWLPFCIFNAKMKKEDLMSITKNYNLTPGEIDRLEEITSICYKSLPSAEDFIEEKRRIYPLLIKDLQDMLPYVETFVTFGSTRGDIDLGVISSSITDEQLDSSFKKDIVNKYPLVDWNTLWFFKSTSGYELTQKIIRSRELAFNIKNFALPVEEKEYVMRNIVSAEVLYGSETRIFEMKKEFFKFLILPPFLEN